MKLLGILFGALFLPFSSNAFSQMQNLEETNEKGEVIEKKDEDLKTKYYREKFEEVFKDYYFDDVWNATIKAIEETGCAIGSKSNAQDEDGFFKGKIVSDFCVFAMKERKDDIADSLSKYSYDMPFIRAAVWESGRMQYKIVIKEKEGEVEMLIKGEISGREGYITSEVHFWKSNGYFEHFLVERIKEILKSK